MKRLAINPDTMVMSPAEFKKFATGKKGYSYVSGGIQTVHYYSQRLLAGGHPVKFEKGYGHLKVIILPKACLCTPVEVVMARKLG